MTKLTYRQSATVRLTPSGDVRALGGAVTLALCGSWNHSGPCPIAEHETTTREQRGLVKVEVTFTVDPSRLNEVRGLITRALASEHLGGPDGRITQWALLDCQPLE